VLQPLSFLEYIFNIVAGHWESALSKLSLAGRISEFWHILYAVVLSVGLGVAFRPSSGGRFSALRGSG
jgi:hypothetical protein